MLNVLLHYVLHKLYIVRELILRALDPRPKERLGYKDHGDIMKLSFFEGKNHLKHLLSCIIFNFSLGMEDALGSGDSRLPSLDIQSSVDPTSVFIEAELDPYSSAVFDQF